MAIFTVILIIYQTRRWFYTKQIALMRDAEERSGVSPPLITKVWWSKKWPFRNKILGYGSEYCCHRWFLHPFKIFALIFLAMRAVEFLFLTQVPLPGDVDIFLK